MILLSKLADYGVILAAHLAQQSGEQMNAVRLAEATRLPRATVAKLLKQLARGGIVTAARGAAGGYRLSRSPTEISVGDVVTAIDGAPSATACSGVPYSCDYLSFCPTRPYWQPINEAIVRALADVPLSRMAGQISLPGHAAPSLAAPGLAAPAAPGHGAAAFLAPLSQSLPNSP